MQLKCIFSKKGIVSYAECSALCLILPFSLSKWKPSATVSFAIER